MIYEMIIPKIILSFDDIKDVELIDNSKVSGGVFIKFNNCLTLPLSTADVEFKNYLNGEMEKRDDVFYVRHPIRIRPKKMTLSEIEKTLGFPIELVDEMGDH